MNSHFVHWAIGGLLAWAFFANVYAKRRPKRAWRAVLWLQHRVARRRLRKAYAYPSRRPSRSTRLLLCLPLYGGYTAFAVARIIEGGAWSWRAYFDMCVAWFGFRAAWGDGPGLRIGTRRALRGERKAPWRGY